MFKKSVCILLVFCMVFCISGCFEKKQYVYKGVGSIFSKSVCIFDKPVTSKEGGNYKWLMREDWEKTEDFDAVDLEDCLDDGTFEWQSKDEVLTFTPSDGTIAKDYYVINDILVGVNDYDSAVEVKRVGEYIAGTVTCIANKTIYSPDGSFVFYLDSDERDGSYSSGEYYIDGNLIYEKYSNDNEYTVGALIFDEKVVDLYLSWAYVLEK